MPPDIMRGIVEEIIIMATTAEEETSRLQATDEDLLMIIDHDGHHLYRHPKGSLIKRREVVMGIESIKEIALVKDFKLKLKKFSNARIIDRFFVQIAAVIFILIEKKFAY